MEVPALLRMGQFRDRCRAKRADVARPWNSRHNARCAVELHPVVVAQPGSEPWYRNDGRDAELPCHDRSVGKQTAPLNQNPGRSGEQDDPAWVRALSDQYLSRSKVCRSRIVHNADGASNHARTATQPLALFSAGSARNAFAPARE